MFGAHVSVPQYRFYSSCTHAQRAPFGPEPEAGDGGNKVFDKVSNGQCQSGMLSFFCYSIPVPGDHESSVSVI